MKSLHRLTHQVTFLRWCPCLLSFVEPPTRQSKQRCLLKAGHLLSSAQVCLHCLPQDPTGISYFTATLSRGTSASRVGAQGTVAPCCHLSPHLCLAHGSHGGQLRGPPASSLQPWGQGVSQRLPQIHSCEASATEAKAWSGPRAQGRWVVGETGREGGRRRAQSTRAPKCPGASARRRPVR